MKEKDPILYPFSNSIIFSLVMNDEERCRKMLERILPERKIKSLRFPEDSELYEDFEDGSNVRREARISRDPYHKSVQLDVLFEGDDSWYDIEMQVENTDSIPKRSRYYHSMLDSGILLKGDKYERLKPCYVIFICCFDLFGKGEALYRFEQRDRKNDLSLGDEAFTIILNSKCAGEKASPELAELFNYINEGRLPERGDGFLDEIDRKVRELNRGKEMRYVISVEQQMQWTIERKVKEQVEEQVKEQVEQRLAEAVAAEVAQRVDAEVAQRVDAEVAQRVDAEVAQRVDAEVAQRVDAEVAQREERLRKQMEERLQAQADAQMQTARLMKKEGIPLDVIARCTGLEEEAVKQL